MLRYRLIGAAAAALAVVSASSAYAAFSPTTAASPAPAAATARAAAQRVTPYIRTPTAKNTAAAQKLHAAAKPAAKGQIPPPPTDAQCQAAFSGDCYTPNQIAHAYGADQAWKKGLDGAGSTIALIDTYGSPTITQDVAAFDAQFALPPADLQVVTYGGSFTDDLSTALMLGWGQEATLDVDYAHALAPRAKLLLVEVAPDPNDANPADQLGLTHLTQAIGWTVERYHPDAISLSWGDMEATFPQITGSPAAGKALLDSLRGGLLDAARHHVTVLAASGDLGPTGPDINGTLFPFQTVSWPASDPAVLAVGGTREHLDATGARTSPAATWSKDGIGAAGGGGVSAMFPRPKYQDPVAGIVGGQFGLPTLAMNGSCDSTVNTWTSFGWNPGDPPSWQQVCGTSESSPLLAALVADTAATAHHPLGAVGADLYDQSARRLARGGIQDVTTGCTADFNLPGFCAGPGFDLATGFGTVDDATAFDDLLVDAARHGD